MTPYNFLLQYTRVARASTHAALIIHFDSSWATLNTLKQFNEKMRKNTENVNILGGYKIAASDNPVLIQCDDFASSLKYMGLIICVNTMCKINKIVGY